MGGYTAIALQKFVPMEMLKWMELSLATPFVLWGAWPFFARGSPENPSLSKEAAG